MLCAVSVIAASVGVTGCASTGPRVSRQEIEEARQALDLKALQFQFRQTLRVNSVGYRLVRHLPPGEAEERAPYIGLLLTPMSAQTAQLYRLPSDLRGVVVVGAVPESPAARAGLAEGDVILAVDGRMVKQPKTVLEILARTTADRQVAWTIWREGRDVVVALQPERLPFRVAFLMVDEQEINASAHQGRRVFVTYGLLRFVESDDELAVILGHELAHHTRHHLPKEFGTSILTSMVGFTAAVGTEILVPGAGVAVLRGVKGAFDATFSQDFEREADDIGLRYAHRAGYDVEAGRRVWERFAVEMPRSMTRHLFSTHPTSPERLVHMEKSAAALKGTPDDTPALTAAMQPGASR